MKNNHSLYLQHPQGVTVIPIYSCLEATQKQTSKSYQRSVWQTAAGQTPSHTVKPSTCVHIAQILKLHFICCLMMLLPDVVKGLR